MSNTPRRLGLHTPRRLLAQKDPHDRNDYDPKTRIHASSFRSADTCCRSCRGGATSSYVVCATSRRPAPQLRLPRVVWRWTFTSSSGRAGTTVPPRKAACSLRAACSSWATCVGSYKASRSCHWGWFHSPVEPPGRRVTRILRRSVVDRSSLAKITPPRSDA